MSRIRKLAMMALQAYYPSEVTYAKDFIDVKDEDRYKNIAADNGHHLVEWLYDHHPQELARLLREGGSGKHFEDYSNAQEMQDDDVYHYIDFYEMDDEIAKEFYEEIAGRGWLNSADSPSQEFFQYRGIVKNQWLIHFTKDAWGIARHGFTSGVNDPNMLGLTTHLRDEAKKRGGYNFAFKLGDFSRYGRDSRRGWKYGNECVLFRASGIEAWHHGDNEPQVIFWGKSARDIVPITEGNDGWQVGELPNGNPVYVSDQLENVVQWVVAHYNQYKKYLSPQEPTAKPVPRGKQSGMPWMADLVEGKERRTVWRNGRALDRVGAVGAVLYHGIKGPSLWESLRRLQAIIKSNTLKGSGRPSPFEKDERFHQPGVSLTRSPQVAEDDYPVILVLDWPALEQTHKTVPRDFYLGGDREQEQFTPGDIPNLDRYLLKIYINEAFWQLPPDLWQAIAGNPTIRNLLLKHPKFDAEQRRQIQEALTP